METFTLEQASYLAEIIGVIAVVISLIFVGLQVRQSNISTRLDTLHNINAEFNNWYESVSVNPELADIYYRGHNDINTLKESEKVQFNLLITRAIRILFEMYSQRQANVVDDKLWFSFIAPIKNAFQFPGVQAHWNTRRQWFDMDFQNFVENNLIGINDAKLSDDSLC